LKIPEITVPGISQKKLIEYPLQKFKIPFWKKLLSYIYEFKIDQIESAEGFPLEVVVSNGRLMLVANNAIYSYDDLYINFTKALLNLNKDLHQDSHVLVLGLGLGSIPYIIEKTLGHICHYTLVEFDDQVIQLASKYGLSRLDSSYEIFCTDAYAFVMQHESKYDLICMDVFNDDVIPSNMTDKAFVQKLKELLAEDGVLLYNRLYQFEKDQLGTDDFERTVFSHLFPQYNFIEVEGNRVYFSQERFLRKE